MTFMVDWVLNTDYRVTVSGSSKLERWRGLCGSVLFWGLSGSGGGGGGSITPPHPKLKSHFTAVTSNGGRGRGSPLSFPTLFHCTWALQSQGTREWGWGGEGGGGNLNYASAPHSSLLQS